MMAPPACRPTRPVSRRISESPMRKVQLCAAGSSTPSACAAEAAAVAPPRRLRPSTPGRGRVSSRSVATLAHNPDPAATCGAARAAVVQLRRVAPAQRRTTPSRDVACVCIVAARTQSSAQARVRCMRLERKECERLATSALSGQRTTGPRHSRLARVSAFLFGAFSYDARSPARLG